MSNSLSIHDSQKMNTSRCRAQYDEVGQICHCEILRKQNRGNPKNKVWIASRCRTRNDDKVWIALANR